MKLARFTSANGINRLGRMVEGGVIDLTPALPGLSGSMRALIADLGRLRPAIETSAGPVLPLASIRLLAPIDDCQKFLAIGMNYKSHAEEVVRAGGAATTSQAWFNKQVSSINGPYDPIDLPQVSPMLDYEGEFAYVIGKRCRGVKAADALAYVAGYMIANDVSVRDWQRASPTVILGKGWDTHGPIGPWITTADEISDPYARELRTFVNGELRQRGSLNDLIYDIGAQIEHISTVMTLEPGDIIITGTPAGVGMATRNWLKPGDVVRVEIDGLGHIENRVELQR